MAVKPPVVAAPESFWERAEDLAAGIKATTQSYFAKLPQNIVVAIEEDVAAGVANNFPMLAPVLADIAPFLTFAPTIQQLVNEIAALKSVPVKPAVVVDPNATVTT